jgi:hypothetical protein
MPAAKMREVIFMEVCSLNETFHVWKKSSTEIFAFESFFNLKSDPALFCSSEQVAWRAMESGCFSGRFYFRTAFVS